MASILNVDQIGHSTSGTAGLQISSSGRVIHPQRPVLSVRGMAGSTSLTAADTNFDYVTSWTTTDVDVGGLLNAGGYAQVPTGFGGTYQVTWIVNGITSSTFNSSVAFSYNGSSYTMLWEHFASNDYTNYTVGTTLFLTLNDGDRVYAGYDDRYGVPSSLDRDCNFSMMFVG